MENGTEFHEFAPEDSLIIIGGRVGMGFTDDGESYGALILQTIVPHTYEHKELVLLVPPMIKHEFLHMLESVKHT